MFTEQVRKKEMPSVHQMLAAHRAIKSYAYETPVIESMALQGKTGHERVVLKCESLQRTGSYHFRGMMYKVMRTKERDLEVNHFVTYSTGNSGPALACAATMFQSTCHVALPDDSSETLKRSIKHYKGTYVACAPTLEARCQATEELVKEYNSGKNDHAIYVPPYEDETVMIGYGTIGIELMLQTDCNLDCIVCPVGGGALISAVAIAVKGMKANVAVVAAEPLRKRTHYAEFKCGGKEKAKKVPEGSSNSGVADRLLTTIPATVRPYVNKYVDNLVQVNEEDINRALRYVYERCKLVIDEKSAVAVAAVLSMPPELEKYKKVGIVLSGANVSLQMIAQLTKDAKL